MLLVGAITVAFVQGFATLDVLMWPALALLITLAPLALSWLEEPPPAAEHAVDLDTTVLKAVA